VEILYLLIPVSVVLVFIIGAFFWWSLHRGQFDDLEGPGYRILMDDDRAQSQAARPSSPASDDDKRIAPDEPR
jgi:cbb3-type cytochrome oxidase maturation protein